MRNLIDMISFDLNHLNGIEFGVILIMLGIFSIWFGNSVYKDYKKENYNLFKITKRENRDDYNKDAYNIFLYWRSIFMVIFGILFILGAILVLFFYFFPLE